MTQPVSHVYCWTCVWKTPGDRPVAATSTQPDGTVPAETVAVTRTFQATDVHRAPEFLHRSHGEASLRTCKHQVGPRTIQALKSAQDAETEGNEVYQAKARGKPLPTWPPKRWRHAHRRATCFANAEEINDGEKEQPKLGTLADVHTRYGTPTVRIRRITCASWHRNGSMLRRVPAFNTARSGTTPAAGWLGARPTYLHRVRRSRTNQSLESCRRTRVDH